MNRFIKLISFAVMALSTFIAYGSTVDFTSDELKWIKEHKTLTLAYPQFEYPPYIIHSKNNRVEGIYPDYFSLISKQTGIKFIIKIYPNVEAILQAIKRQEVDLVVGFKETKERQTYLSFSNVFLTSPRAMLMKKNPNQAEKSELKHFEKLTFASEKALSAFSELKQQNKNIDIFPVDSVAEAITAVKFGLADAYYADKYTSQCLMKLQKKNQLMLIELTDVPEIKSQIAVNKSLDKFVDILNKSIATIDEFTHASIISRWNNSNTGIKNKPLPSSFTLAEKQWLEKNQVIRYTSTTNSAPMAFASEQDNTVQGYSIDVLKLVATKLGVSLEYVETETREQAVQWLLGDKVSVFPFFVDMNRASQDISYSDSYMSSPWVVLTNSYSPITFKHLKNNSFRMAIPKGFIDTAYLKEHFPYAQVNFTATMQDAIDLLKSEKVEAIFSLLPISSHWLQGNYFGQFKVINDLNINQKIQIKMATSDKNPILQSLINKALQNISAQELERINDQWLNYVVNQSFDLKKVIIPASAIAMLFLLVIARFVYWNRKLKTEVKQRTKAEKRAIDAEHQAKEHAKAKTDFLARMSHEIRTPMNGVLGMTEALNYTKLSVEQTDLLSTLQGSARNLMALLNDVLDFSKMDAGKVTFEEIPYDINNILHNCVENYRHRAQSSKIDLTYHVDQIATTVFIGDPSRLTQILNNLVSNAIKFTEHGFIEVRASLLEKSANEMLVQFDIRDTGIGIPKASISTLFNAFVQAEGDTTRRFGGSGLGLAICHELITAMKGTITVASEVNIGSVFSVVLPITYLPNETHESLAEQIAVKPFENHNNVEQDLSSLKVLFAEDNPVNRKVISGQLARLGIKADIVPDGKFAYEKFKQTDYDIIVSDCHMPNMDGFELASKVQSQRQGSKPFLIALTADAMSGSAQKCLESGFDDYISKPCPQDTLLKKLKEALNVIDNTYDLPLTLENLHYDEQIENNDEDDSIELLSAVEHETLLDDLFDKAPNEPIEKAHETAPLSEECSIELRQTNTEPGVKTARDSDSEPKPEPDKKRDSASIQIPNELFDIEKLLGMSGGDRFIAVDILDSFIESNTEDQLLITQSTECGDAELTKQIVHRVKGSIRYLACAPLCNLAERIETTIAEQHSVESVKLQLISFLQHLDNLCHEIKRWQSKNSATEES